LPNADDPRIQSGLADQARARRAVLDGGARRLGWKAGLGTAAAMENVGTTEPISGFLTDATLVADGGAVAVGGWGNARLEAEVAVRVGADVAAGATRDEVLAAVDAIAPAIELVDLGAPDDLAAVLGGNVFHRAVLLGDFVACPGGEGLAAARLEVDAGDGEAATDVDPSVVLGDLAEVVRAIAAQLPLTDDALRAGDVVITGAAIPAAAVAPGGAARVALAGGPAVSVRLVD